MKLEKIEGALKLQLLTTAGNCLTLILILILILAACSCRGLGGGGLAAHEAGED